MLKEYFFTHLFCDLSKNIYLCREIYNLFRMTDYIKLHTTPSISIKQLLALQGGVQIMIPLDEQTLNSEMVNKIRWHEVVDGDMLPTINVGKLSLKALILKATIHQNNIILLRANNGKEILIGSDSKGMTVGMTDDYCLTRISGYSSINEHLQFCFTLTKEVMRTETIAFLRDEFPDRIWYDVYGECIINEALAKPDNIFIQTLKDNWEQWGNYDVEFSNYFILINQLKDRLKKRYGWSSNLLSKINSATKKVKDVRNPSSHQNLNDDVLQSTDSTIEAMKTIIKGYEKSMGSVEVERRCRQLEEKRCLIESIKKEMNIKTNNVM